jgi:hypothetical protein
MESGAMVTGARGGELSRGVSDFVWEGTSLDCNICVTTLDGIRAKRGYNNYAGSARHCRARQYLKAVEFRAG